MTPATMQQNDLDLDTLTAQLGNADPEQIIRWAADTFGSRLVLTSSFGAQAAVMLHLVTRVVPDIPVILIDTGYLFPETYTFAQSLTERLGLNLKVYQPLLSPARHEALHGRLWENGIEGLNQYDQERKVEPLQRALRELDATAWLAGLRREQTEHRATLRPVEQQNQLYKVHPILNWTTKDVHEYLTRHGLPYHPLYEKGYKSIGDTHSTRPITDQMDERAGRFHGLKQECGLHLPETAEESESRDASGL
jgi:phosphoadenosine phosphosulfate reductase